MFHEADGVDDWRVLWSVAFALYRTGDFATGLRLVAEIGRLAEVAGHHPDLNLRSGVLEAGRNRIHIDVGVPHEQAEARVAAALAAGGRLVTDRFAPMWWTLADPEGNEVDLATWIGRD